MNKDDVLLLKLINKDGKNISSRLAEKLNISRQAASARIRRAEKEGKIKKNGKTKGVSYELIDHFQNAHKYENKNLSEDEIWSTMLKPVVSNLPENIKDIWHYSFTEIVNNAIEHSNAKDISIHVRMNDLYVQVFVMDDGVGIFTKIQKALGLFDPRQAILELAKGKFTTDPSNHSGEGIFFSSKMLDVFNIFSNNLAFIHESERKDDWLLDGLIAEGGTVVKMCLFNDSILTTKEIFDKYSDEEHYTFAKTIVPVRLAQYEGEKLISRSQARRLIFRFDKFQTVVLDFDGVEEIGQSFADEVFRVFKNSHPNTELIPFNTNKYVQNMISRALTTNTL